MLIITRLLLLLPNELADEEFLKCLVDTGKSIILSTGMSTEAQVDKAVDILYDNLEYILACTSTYPTVIEELNLRYIQTLKEQYSQYIGFSNHYSGFESGFGAAALGAECIKISYYKMIELLMVLISQHLSKTVIFLLTVSMQWKKCWVMVLRKYMIVNFLLWKKLRKV